MIKAIDNKPLDLTAEEFDYYNNIIAEFGKDVFKNLFDVDNNEGSKEYGAITLIHPYTNIPIGVVFFLFNVQLNQQKRKINSFLVSYEEQLESKIKKILAKDS